MDVRATIPQAAPNQRAFRRLKFWVWFQDRTRPTDLQVTLFWAGVIGFCGGLSSIAFRAGTSAVHKILTGSSTPGLVESFVELPAWMRVAIPALGGLIAGAILQFGARWRSRIPTTDYMEAVVLGDGRISTRRTLVKSLSALFTIASGGSIGREGPLVQLSSVIASGLGRLQKWSTPRLRLLVGCGAAAGIASAYNAPIAGAIFVAEIVLGSMAMEMLGPLIFSSVVATLTVQGFLGSDPLYQIPPFQLNRNWEIAPYLLLGLIAGLVAPWFIRLLRMTRTNGCRAYRGARLPQDVRGRINRRRARDLASGSLRQRLQHGERDLAWPMDLANARRDFHFQNPCDHGDVRVRRGRRRLYADTFHRRQSRFSLRHGGSACISGVCRSIRARSRSSAWAHFSPRPRMRRSWPSS